MKELKQMLVQFKGLTIEMISVLQKDEVYKLDVLINSRQVLIDKIEKLNYTTEEFANICNEFGILSLQQELSGSMQEKKDNTKGKLDKIQVTKNANNNYNKSFYDNACTFNKQI